MAATLDMVIRGREMASVGVMPLHSAVDHGYKEMGSFKISGLPALEQVHKKHKGSPSSAELRLIQKYIHEARPLEDGIDEVALRKLVKSSTFKKFVQRLELENEVVDLHKQLEKEVELHNTLESALSHTSSTQLPDSVLYDLPSNVQRLLTDIAMLEVAVLRLETQATALQWDIVHERTERSVTEHLLNSPLDVSLQSVVAKLVPASPPRSPRVVQPRSRSPAPSEVPPPSVKSSARATSSPALATLKELLKKPVPEPEQQFCTPPKSPRQSLRSLWGALDGQTPTSFLTFSKKDRTRSASPITNRQSPPDVKTCVPSSARVVPSNLHLSTSLSPFTPGEEPRNTTPVTPACQPDLPVARKSLNPVKLLPSAKRLSFWNFASFTEDRSAKPTPEIDQCTVSLPREGASKPDEDFTDDIKIHKLRRSWGMKRSDQSQSPRSPLDSARSSTTSSSISNRSDSSSDSPRKSFKESPRQSTSGKQELPSDANRLSEDMVRCMVDIYCHLAEPSCETQSLQECPLSPSSHAGRLSASSSLNSQSDSFLPSGARSPELDPGRYGDVMGDDTTPDPYKSMGKLPWTNIGPYTDAHEVPWLSVGKDQLEYVARSLGRFRLLVERLTKVDPSAMTHEQKLAFWINLYNALLMHAFLAYGIPRSDLKFFSLMQKAAYCVGGHWFNAATIECNLLKAKIMLHRPQFALIMALQTKKLTEEQSKYGIDRADPKVNFALACGSHSSPMVRIYTPEYIHDDLDSAFQDFLRATVGLTSKGRILLPKLVYNYAREFVDDDAILEWVCRFLPVAQVAVIYECTHQRYRRRMFNSSPFSVSPHSFAFRYLFPKGFSCAVDVNSGLDLSSCQK